MTRCWVCNEEFGVDGVHICANTPFKIKPTMTKVTIDRALIERAVDAAFSPYCAQDLAILAPALRAALAEPAVEPCGYDETTGNCTHTPCCFLPMEMPPAEVLKRAAEVACDAIAFNGGSVQMEAHVRAAIEGLK